MTVWNWASYGYTRVEPALTDAASCAAGALKEAIDVGEEFGACHIVISDLNIDDDHLEFCLAQPEITPQGKAAMDVLRGLPRRERLIALAAAAGEKWSAMTEEKWAEFDWEPDEDLDEA